MSKNKYTPPILTVVEFCAERGYAESVENIVPQAGMLQLLFNQASPGRETESFETHSTWTEGSNGFWE